MSTQEIYRNEIIVVRCRKCEQTKSVSPVELYDRDPWANLQEHNSYIFTFIRDGDDFMFYPPRPNPNPEIARFEITIYAKSPDTYVVGQLYSIQWARFRFQPKPFINKFAEEIGDEHTGEPPK